MSIAAFQAVDPASIPSLSFHKAGPKSILNSFCDIWLRQKLLDGSFDSRKGLALPVWESNPGLPNQIKSKSLLLSHHHSTSALVSEIIMSVLQTVQKNNRQFTYGQTVQKNNRQFTYGQTVQKNNNSNLHMDRQCKKATAIYIWTVHIYRLYRRQCAKYTYIYSVHIVYYKDILNYQRHIIHRMGTSALCTVSIHNVVYA